MKRIVLSVAAGAAALVAGALAFVWSGVYDVAASRGHTAVIGWFLEAVMRNSVRTYAFGIAPPALDDEALVLRGAGHFQGACSPCHGAPGSPPSAVVRYLLPPAPDLAAQVPTWSDGELFWIVKHGVKYTGMPGWPAPSRDDEVWAVVAFLRALPGLDAAAYRNLAFAAAAEPDSAAEALAHRGPVGRGVAACGRCHGMDGEGPAPGVFPRLGVQSEAYLLATLRDFAIGARPSGMMQVPAGELGDEELQRLAAFYAGSAKGPARVEHDPALLRAGQELALNGDPERGVPACASCHGPDGRSVNPLFPNLAGQYPAYLAQQLELWRRGARGATPTARIMSFVARNLDDEQIRAVSAFYAASPAR